MDENGKGLGQSTLFEGEVLGEAVEGDI